MPMGAPGPTRQEQEAVILPALELFFLRYENRKAEQISDNFGGALG